jgi:hypothetical protein
MFRVVPGTANDDGQRRICIKVWGFTLFAKLTYVLRTMAQPGYSSSLAVAGVDFFFDFLLDFFVFLDFFFFFFFVVVVVLAFFFAFSASSISLSACKHTSTACKYPQQQHSAMAPACAQLPLAAAQAYANTQGAGA